MDNQHRDRDNANEREMSVTADAESAAPRLLRGMPVFGRDGTRLGELTRDGDEGGVLVMHRIMGGPEIPLPEDVVTGIEPEGVYTNLTWNDLDALLPPPPPGSEMGLLESFATGAEAAHANRFEDDQPS